MNKERLSQLIDGELDAQGIESALDELLANPEQQRSWQAMHIARAGMGVEDTHLSLNIADKVSAALENEPTIMSPNGLLAEQTPSTQAQAQTQTQADNVIPMPTNQPKAWAFMAVAASVAALVMLSYLPQNERTAPNIADSGVEFTQPSVDMELQSMIVQHGEFSGAAALNGLAAYAKVVNGSSSGY